MIIERNIKGIEIDVDTSESNEIYLPESVASNVKKDGIEGILDAIYEKANCEHILLSVFIELTDKCNFSCPFCYINENGKEHHSLPRFDELKQTLDFLIDKGLLYCTLSGGECLTHPDFSRIYSHLKKHGVLVSVFSNGYLIDDTIISLFKQYKPFKVEISIYGIDDNTYRKTVANRGVIAKTVFDNILKIKNIGIDITCKTPITSLTEDSFHLIKNWCDDNEISFYWGYELQATYSGTSRSMYLASEEIRRQMRKESDQAFYDDPHMTELANSSPERKRAFDCSAGKTELYISSKYDLIPCMKAIGINEWTFSIAEQGIQQAYSNLLSKIQNVKNQPLQYCLGCTHHKVCQECFFTQFDYDDIAQHRTDYCKSLRLFCSKIHSQRRRNYPLSSGA